MIALAVIVTLQYLYFEHVINMQLHLLSCQGVQGLWRSEFPGVHSQQLCGLSAKEIMH